MALLAIMFIYLGLAWAQQPPAVGSGASRESYLDIISKAQNLTLQRDRLQATQILIRASKVEKPGSVAQRQLRQTLTTLAEVLYTEKGQQLFELGQSLAEPKLAVEKFAEALVLEPGNTKIMKNLARAKLRAQECSEALAASDKALEVDPCSPELQLVRLQALQCQGEQETAHAYLLSQTENLRALRPAFELAVLRDLMGQKHWLDVRRKANEYKNLDKDFPEFHWVLFRAGQELKAADIQSGERYLRACQTPALEKIRRRYEIEPSLCLAQREVEKILAPPKLVEKE